VTEGDRPRVYGLDARLDRLERELARLSSELAEARALVRAEATPAPPPEASVVTPAPPPAPMPTPAPAPPPPSPPALQAPAPRPAPSGRPSPGAPPADERRPAAAQAPAKPPGRTFAELARDWDLTGARGFAIAGGIVMALGIALFFVLAANRGWIDERARVALGASASAAVFGAGLLLRARYGQYWTALAAVGAGIAGAYATLAAAAARYDLVPDGLALPLAGLIAAAGTVVSIRWRSQVIAAIGLLGAALAPALQAVDTEMSWESAAFAAIVLVAVGVVAVPRAWHELLVSASLVVGAQVEWLAAEPSPVPRGSVAVAAAFVLTLLGIAVARQLVSKQVVVDPLALSYAIASFGLCLALATQVLDERGDRGIALLVAAAVWALVFAGLHRVREPDLAAVIGTSALALAVVGTADLLSGASLTLAWAAQAVVLAALARRLGDARLQAMGAGYVALAAAHAFATDARPAFLFDTAADHRAAVLPLAAAATAAAAAGVLVPESYVVRGEGGLLAFVGSLRRTLAASRRGYRETGAVAAAALATLAAAFALVSISYEWGHIASTVLAAAVGAVILGLAGALRSDGLAASAYAWLGVALVVALAYDSAEFYEDATGLSTGGWAVAASAAAILVGAYAHRVAWPASQARDVVVGVSVAIAAVAAALGVSFLTEDALLAGLGLLAFAVAYLGLAAGVFTREGFRNGSTVLWSLGLVLLIGAESLLLSDPVWRTVVVAATAFALGALASPLRESRLWLAGWALLLASSAVALLALVQPWLSEGELDRRTAIASTALAVVAFGLAALVWGRDRWRDLSTVMWAAGLLLVLATERVVIDDLRLTAFVIALTGTLPMLAARPLREPRLWLAGSVVVGATTVATIATWTHPAHLLSASESPAEGLWVLAACIAAIVVATVTAPDEQTRALVGAIAGGLALYGASLGILEIAEHVSSASVETDFERGHTAVSGLWALVGLGLLVVGLLRGSALVRYAGLAVFGLSLAKIFLYDLASLSSVARAFSFILVGGLLLAGGFFVQRLSDRIGPRPGASPQ